MILIKLWFKFKFENNVFIKRPE